MERLGDNVRRSSVGSQAAAPGRSQGSQHADTAPCELEVSIGIQNFGIPIPTDNRHRNSVGHQQIYRTDFGTTPKDLTSRAINLHYYFRVVLKTLSCSVYLALKC